jgi:hypothetical protein
MKLKSPNDTKLKVKSTIALHRTSFINGVHTATSFSSRATAEVRLRLGLSTRDKLRALASQASALALALLYEP